MARTTGNLIIEINKLLSEVHEIESEHGCITVSPYIQIPNIKVRHCPLHELDPYNDGEFVVENDLR